MDLEAEYNVTNLSHQYVLPVARGLVALILHNSANVDMFLLACKVSLTGFENLSCHTSSLYRSKVYSIIESHTSLCIILSQNS